MSSCCFFSLRFIPFDFFQCIPLGIFFSIGTLHTIKMSMDSSLDNGIDTCDGSVLSPGAPTLWRYNHGCMTTAIHDSRHTSRTITTQKRGLYKGCRKPVLNRVQTGLTVTCCAGCRSTPHTGPCRLLHAPADSSTPIRVSAVALTGFPDTPSPFSCDSPVASTKYRESASALPFFFLVRYWTEYW